MNDYMRSTASAASQSSSAAGRPGSSAGESSGSNTGTSEHGGRHRHHMSSQQQQQQQQQHHAPSFDSMYYGYQYHAPPPPPPPGLAAQQQQQQQQQQGGGPPPTMLAEAAIAAAAVSATGGGGGGPSAYHQAIQMYDGGLSSRGGESVNRASGGGGGGAPGGAAAATPAASGGDADAGGGSIDSGVVAGGGDDAGGGVNLSSSSPQPPSQQQQHQQQQQQGLHQESTGAEGEGSGADTAADGVEGTSGATFSPPPGDYVPVGYEPDPLSSTVLRRRQHHHNQHYASALYPHSQHHHTLLHHHQQQQYSNSRSGQSSQHGHQNPSPTAAAAATTTSPHHHHNQLLQAPPHHHHHHNNNHPQQNHHRHHLEDDPSPSIPSNFSTEYKELILGRAAAAAAAAGGGAGVVMVGGGVGGGSTSEDAAERVAAMLAYSNYTMTGGGVLAAAAAAAAAAEGRSGGEVAGGVELSDKGRGADFGGGLEGLNDENEQKRKRDGELNGDALNKNMRESKNDGENNQKSNDEVNQNEYERQHQVSRRCEEDDKAFSSFSPPPSYPPKPPPTAETAPSCLTSSSVPTESSSSSSTATANSATTPNSATSSHATPPPSQHSAGPTQTDDLLTSLTLMVPGVSLKKLTGHHIVEIVSSQTDDVVTRYLPCVDFLVSCQQELRAGLAQATKKRMVNRHCYRDSMTPRQFYNQYLAPLPSRFYQQNESLMAPDNLRTAYTGLKALNDDAKAAEINGCEAMKNAFLGGMRDGESWGLRRWLSKNGGALKICNDLELILNALQKLDREGEATKKLGELVRPRSKLAFDRLKNDVPSAYQEVSSAHPYLPFFHRLESALSGLANFDPEDDDIVIIDDEDEIEEIKNAPPKKPTKRKAGSDADCSDGCGAAGGDVGGGMCVPKKRKTGTKERHSQNRGSNGRSDEEDSDIEIVCIMPPREEEGGENDSSGEKGSETSEPKSSVNVSRKQSPQPQPQERRVFNMNKQKALLSREKGRKGNFMDWRCQRCTFLNTGSSNKCAMCDDDDTTDENDESRNHNPSSSLPTFQERPAGSDGAVWNPPGALDGRTVAAKALASFAQSTTDSSTSDVLSPSEAMTNTDDLSNSLQQTAEKMIKELDSMADRFDSNTHQSLRPDDLIDHTDFWNSPQQYAYALRLLSLLLRQPTCHRFLEPVDETALFMEGKPQYSSIIKHPLCFADLMDALKSAGGERRSDPRRGTSYIRKKGQLPVPSLRQWNMWNGRCLLQAVDLIFLNALAFNGKGKTDLRVETGDLRKLLWDRIGKRANGVKKSMPTKRGEKSGFVILKNS